MSKFIMALDAGTTSNRCILFNEAGEICSITKVEEIEPAFREAMKSEKTPYILEFVIDPEDLVYPMIEPGGTLEDMILDC